MSHEKILALLKGCDAQKPMAFDALQERSGLEMMLEQLYNGHAINRAVVMRDGATQTQVWPTGVISRVSLRDPFRVTPASTLVVVPQPAGTPAPQTHKGVATMEKITQQHIIDRVVAQPGIARDEIMARLVSADGSNKKQVIAAIGNALQAKKLTQSKESGKACLHPGDKKSDRARALPQRTKQVPKKTQRPVGARRAVPTPSPAPTVISGAFRVAYYEDQGFTLCKDGLGMMLDETEVERLRRFLARISGAGN